jgi:hypothetical protein
MRILSPSVNCYINPKATAWKSSPASPELLDAILPIFFVKDLPLPGGYKTANMIEPRYKQLIAEHGTLGLVYSDARGFARVNIVARIVDRKVREAIIDGTRTAYTTLTLDCSYNGHVFVCKPRHPPCGPPHRTISAARTPRGCSWQRKAPSSCSGLQ